MKTENEATSKRELSGYKLATILISILSILVIFFQAIYNNYYNQRWKEIEYCESKINSKRSELIRLKEIPKVLLRSNTLIQAGLSKQMLRSLSALPSTVSIEHAEGNTVEGIYLEIISKEPISQFQKWDSPEEFVITHLNDNNDKLILKAQQLRKGTTIGVTILTKKPTEISTNIVIDKGELIKKNNSSSYSYKNRSLSDAEFFSSNDLEKLNIDDFISWRDFSSESESAEIINIEKEIFLLNKKVERLKSQSLWSWILPEFNFSFILIILLLALIFLPLIMLFPDYKKRSKRAELIFDIKANKFNDISLYNLFSELGCPDNLYVIEAEEKQKIAFSYFSKYELIPSKGVRFTFVNNQLDEIYDEKKREVIKSFINKN